MPGQAKNKKCWAHHLGSCTSISGEHVISRGVLAASGRQAVSLLGNERVPDGEHSIRKLVANVLCEKHNNELSSLDDEASKLANFLVQVAMGLDPMPQVINGPTLERWATKTAINSLAAGWSDKQKWEPDKEIVRAIFGLTGRPAGYGIYFIQTGIVHREHRLSVRVANIFAGYEPGKRGIAGVFIDINSLRMFVSFIPHAPEQFRRLMKGEEYAQQQFIWRPSELHVAREGAGSACIRLHWPYLYV